jgi:hypothetical protein
LSTSSDVGRAGIAPFLVFTCICKSKHLSHLWFNMKINFNISVYSISLTYRYAQAIWETKELEGFGITTAVKTSLFNWFSIFNAKKTDPNCTNLVRFKLVLGLVRVILIRNKEYYFPVQLNFWVKTGPNRTPYIYIRH